MASILRPLAPVTKALRAFFKADLRLRRGDRGLEVVLDDPTPKARPAKARTGKGDTTSEQERRELQCIQAALARLLDELPENRVALRHLAFIEHALGKKGLRALHKVPVDVLRRALDQFEGLVVNWSDEGLAALRSKMAVALIEREQVTESRQAPVSEVLSSELDAAPLAHPEPLEGDAAAEAEAALRAAYGSVVLPPLELTMDDEEPALEMQGELNSPSAKALAKAVRRGDEPRPAAARTGSA